MDKTKLYNECIKILGTFGLGKLPCKYRLIFGILAIILSIILTFLRRLTY